MPLQFDELDTATIWARAEQLQDDDHLKNEVKRSLGPLRTVTGTRNMPPTQDLIHNVALGVAIIEARVAAGEDNPAPIIGPIMVTHNPLSGYDLWVRTSTVYTSHLARRP